MYEVSKKNIIKNLLINFTISIVLLGFLAIALITIKSGGALFMTSPFFVIIMALLIIFGAFNIKEIVGNIRRYKNINDLSKNAKLIKRIPYQLKNSNLVINSISLKKIYLRFKSDNGIILNLESEPRFDTKHLETEGYADLLIDEKDPTKFYIDTNINRISGNKEEDFYK